VRDGVLGQHGAEDSEANRERSTTSAERSEAREGDVRV
jgi:hypothetical protein